jgi:hypothetical protein
MTKSIFIIYHIKSLLKLKCELKCVLKVDRKVNCMLNDDHDLLIYIVILKFTFDVRYQ